MRVKYRSHSRRLRIFEIALFVFASSFITCFLNIPSLRTFAPLALARVVKLVKATSAPSSDMPTSGDPELDALIAEIGMKRGVDPRLIHAVIRQESNYRAQLVSPRGALGLMQLMPATARRFDCQNLRDPRENVEAGVKYLRWLLERYDGDVERALAGYNAGEGAVDDYDGVPPFHETQGYVRRVISHYGKRTHPVLPPEEARRAFDSTAQEETTTQSVRVEADSEAENALR